MDKVLIAEDDFTLRTLIKAYLKKFDDQFTVTAVEDGLKAIEVLQREKVSLLVTDLQMPKVEGVVLLAYMNRNFPRIPCIVMTSMRNPYLKKRLQKDVLYYIEKPFDEEQLAKAILSALKTGTMGGTLDGISISSFLQLIEIEGQTCICVVEAPGYPKGYFYFEEGVLHQAFFGEIRGEEAAVELIRLGRGDVRFRKPKETEDRFDREIRTELIELITRALRPTPPARAG